MPTTAENNARKNQIYASQHLRVTLIDVNKFVKVNDLKPITNPVLFQRNNIPTSDGLLSNEIFGITMYDRSNTCAYIDLHEDFLHPLVYKVWSKLDKKIVECVYGTKKFIVNGSGELEENENGYNGVAFLKKNFDKINIARTSSLKRDLNVNFIEACKKEPGAFINKQIVIPAFYRDVDTSKGGRVTIGEINELYRNLIVAAKSLKESSGYGFDLSVATKGRIQGILVQIYDWFGQGTTVNGSTTSPNIPGKIGLYRRAVNSKTTDYANRLVLSAPDLKYEKAEDMQASLKYSAIPLASALSTFMPFVIFIAKRYFESMFSGNKSIPYFNDKTKKFEGSYHVKDYQIQFSEDRIKKEIDRFLTGNSNRLIPITVETEEGKKVNLRFKGYNTSLEEIEKGVGNLPIVERNLTWCDIFYMSAVEATRDKHVVITRYPFDSIYNQFATRVRVNSMNETEQMVVDNKYYSNYPKIRDNMIGKNTSNMFVDTLNLSNLYLPGIGGDYDGDTATVKGIYSDEANAELEENLNKNYTYINSAGKGIRNATQECIQAMYNMTLVMDEDKSKLSVPKF